MADVSQDLGSRIVQAARLAVAMHLAGECSGVDSSQRKSATGGAGPSALTDERPLLMTGERPRRSAPSTPWFNAGSADRGESEAA